MLGPLSRFAYDAGMEPPAFVAWRAAFGFLALAAYVGWRVRHGATRLVRFSTLPTRARVAMLAAALAGTVLNLCMFFAFDRITIALALLGFYTYPALVAIANACSDASGSTARGWRIGAGGRRDDRGRRLPARPGGRHPPGRHRHRARARCRGVPDRSS